LRTLCDETRFPAWPLADQVPFLQALLEEWRAELARKPLGMSEADALRALGLDPGNEGVVEEEALKAAYRRLARKYHPGDLSFLMFDYFYCSSFSVGSFSSYFVF
jgi:DnaJ homolog subfamily C member 13